MRHTESSGSCKGLWAAIVCLGALLSFGSEPGPGIRLPVTAPVEERAPAAAEGPELSTGDVDLFFSEDNKTSITICQPAAPEQDTTPEELLSGDLAPAANYESEKRAPAGQNPGRGCSPLLVCLLITVLLGAPALLLFLLMRRANAMLLSAWAASGTPLQPDDATDASRR